MTDWTLLAPDDDARALDEAAGAHFAALRGPDAMRAAIDGTPADDGWKVLADGGYPDIAVPEDLGGAGRLIDLAVVLEAAGRTLLTPGLLPSALATRAQLAAGVHRAEFRSRPAGFALARGRVAGGRCSVERAHVLGGLGAATLTLVVAGADGAWVAVVDPQDGGVELVRESTVIDPSRPVPAYRLTNARCLAERAVELERALAECRVCLGADLLGTAAGALTAAVAHAQSRRQFGQPIGAFQAVKHQLAEAYVAVERARSLTYGAALGESSPLLANAAAAEAAVLVASRYTQLMGAMGVTFEADCHLFLRRAHQTAGLLGTPDELYAAAAREAR
ncbi:acyl-CoA dehydrogenase family protein [Dactylosporangium sp. AC04546]|uniref:acyl-CoA dehydrogenase family protein n=1 Tax=Dactylosporangium sp. AC04546 TaxID=2862460 RepID=UPI001EDE92C2|nr:acyl-CoA dehydrogenase family protein [Dactylosporangium sp. AC04546]WVK88448.1 acyl-CoA dehydrogenase family protein [Dactylosporangium sp. AC04546]